MVLIVINWIGEIMKDYDIIVVGAGASGAFLAYELTKLNTNKKYS